MAFVEWYFKCNYRNKISEFDGVSIIKFDEANKIISVKEFQSDSMHIYPYLSVFIRMKIILPP